MSKEDRVWLTEALKAYTFNDTDRLQTICKEIADKNLAAEKLVDLLEELQELVELHPRNNHNLCLSGGMTEILAMIFSHPSPDVKKRACSIFTTASSNNSEVQKFGAKAGALNLVSQVEAEQDLVIKEALFSALSSFIKAENFNAKRLFIRDFDGLAFMTRLLC